MAAGKHITAIVASSLALAALTACKPNNQPTTQPAAGSASEIPSLLAPESLDWSREDACGHLEDDKLSICAAIRLVRLATVSPLCAPDDLTDDLIRRLDVVRLNDEHWALGVLDRYHDRRLRAPVLISSTGDVALLAEGVEEEMLILHVAKDPDVFPHVAVLPHRVLLVGEEVATALALAPDQKVRFDLRFQGEFPYVALVLLDGGESDEVARYVWDPWELAFSGPAIDRLPTPPGGKFRIDLKGSPRLIPIGGELPEPEPIEELPPQQPEHPPWFDDDLLPA